MKVLIVTNLYPTKERPFMSPFVKEQVESIREHCDDIMIDVHVIEGNRPRLAYIKSMLRLPAIVKKGKYDIVHAHFGLSLISTLLVRAPIVVTFHGSDLLVNPTKLISKLFAPTAKKVIVVAKRLRDSLGYGNVIPCGISTKKFILPPSSADRISPDICSELKILFPSNPAIKVKNYALFRAVCQELENRGNKIKEIILMNVDRGKVPELYWDCNIMLLTSLSEGSPTVIKEAIAAKLPFVSVDVGDVKEWAALVGFGTIVKEREPKKIADAVEMILTKIERRYCLNNNKCITQMDNAYIAKKIREVYCQVIEEPLSKSRHLC